ncbi:MAG: hypothetical protein ACK53Y_26205, partial [bacterium]
EIRVHALHIVNNFLPNLSAKTAKKLFVPLSKLLGPSKSNAGILSPDIRALVIDTLGKVSIFVGSKLHEVVSALQRLHTRIQSVCFKQIRLSFNQALLVSRTILILRLKRHFMACASHMLAQS